MVRIEVRLKKVLRRSAAYRLAKRAEPDPRVSGLGDPGYIPTLPTVLALLPENEDPH